MGNYRKSSDVGLIRLVASRYPLIKLQLVQAVQI